MVSLRLAVLAVLIVVVSAGCGGNSRRSGGGSNGSNQRLDSKSAVVNFDRNINAKVGGKLKFGPCGRPRTNVNADVKDTGRTQVKGSAFQALETAGRFAEVLKLVGNRYKPEVNCPPRPASNVDTSAEGILAQRTVRRKPGKSSGRYICKIPGRRRVIIPEDSVSDSESGSGSGRGHGSGRGSGSGYGSGRGRRLNKDDYSDESTDGGVVGPFQEHSPTCNNGNVLGHKQGGHGGHTRRNHGGHHRSCGCRN